MGDKCDKLRPSLIFAKGLLGERDIVGVEVGVDEGEHANRILLEWSNVKKLYLVDIVDNIHDRFKAEGDRVEFLYESSVEASKRFQDNTLDFVYIDDDHSKKGATNSLSSWYPKIKIGGVIGGHDFGGEVEEAVREFFVKNDISLYVGGPDFWGIKR